MFDLDSSLIGNAAFSFVTQFLMHYFLPLTRREEELRNYGSLQIQFAGGRI